MPRQHLGPGPSPLDRPTSQRAGHATPGLVRAGSAHALSAAHDSIAQRPRRRHWHPRGRHAPSRRRRGRAASCHHGGLGGIRGRGPLRREGGGREGAAGAGGEEEVVARRVRHRDPPVHPRHVPRPHTAAPPPPPPPHVRGSSPRLSPSGSRAPGPPHRLEPAPRRRGPAARRRHLSEVSRATRALRHRPGVGPARRLHASPAMPAGIDTPDAWHAGSPSTRLSCIPVTAPPRPAR